MLEFKVCIPDDKTEQILQLFKELQISYQPVIKRKLSTAHINQIKERASSNDFSGINNQNTYQILIHDTLKQELSKLSQEVKIEFNKILDTLQRFPLTYPIAHTKFKVASTEFFNLYYQVKEDLKCCLILSLEKK